MAIVINTAVRYQVMDGLSVGSTYDPPMAQLSEAEADYFYRTLGISRMRSISNQFPTPGAQAKAHGATSWAIFGIWQNFGHLPANRYSGPAWTDTLLPAYYAEGAALAVSYMNQGAAAGSAPDVIELANEPDNGSTYPDIVWLRDYVLPALDAAGYTTVKLAGPSSMGYDAGSQAWAETCLNDPTLGPRFVPCFHAYTLQLTTPNAVAESKGAHVWIGEYNHYSTGTTFDQSMTTGLTLAQRINTAFHDGHASLFSYHLPRNPSDASQTEGGRANLGLQGPNGEHTKREYVFAHYARWIRPGYQHVSLTGAVGTISASAYVGSGGQLVVVLINTGTSPSTADMSGLGSGTFVRYETRDTAIGAIGSSGNVERMTDVAPSGGAASISLPAKSVTTLVSGLTLSVGPVVGGSVTVSGTRAASATVTVTAPGAVVGTVSYPDATTWSCAVSALPLGATSIAATSGAATASATVQWGALLASSAISGAGSLGPVQWTTSQGLPLRDATTKRWCPLRYTASGRPLWIRRS